MVRPWQKHLVALVTGTLTCAGLVAAPIAATASETGGDPEPPTRSSIPLHAVHMPEGYTQVGATDEEEASLQQEELVVASPATDSYVARADLNSSLAVAGVTWDAAATAPQNIDIRFLQDDSWTAWQPLAPTEVSSFEEPSTERRTGTEPLPLVGVDSVEVAVQEGDSSSFQLEIIDPTGAAEVADSYFELNAPAEPQWADKPAEDDSADQTEPPASEEGTQPEQSGAPNSADLPASEELPGVAELPGAGALEVEAASYPEAPESPANAQTDFQTGIDGLIIKTREAWGADETLMTAPSQDVHFTDSLIETTGGADNYSADQVPALIRGLYFYYTQALQQGDIGHHLVVDRFGGVWQGRAGDLAGTNKGIFSAGVDDGTYGVLLLGPGSEDSERAAEAAIAWKLANSETQATPNLNSTPNPNSAPAPNAASPAPYSSVAPSQARVAQAWDPGNVISDAVFYSPTAMNEEQIKQFILKENASCKSGNGATCLKDKKFPTTNLAPERKACKPLNLSGNQPAWTIIDKTAKACGLNPQVILATLQKESSGVVQPKTDAQWAKAMGAGCPDGKGCGDFEAGFVRQIYYGADKLAGYRVNPTWEKYMIAFRDKKSVTVPNNPDPKCGSQTFKLANNATASLYMYTPYVGGSSVSGCGAIGVKSFHTIMKRWFNGGTAGPSTPTPQPPAPTPKPPAPTPKPPAPLVSWGTKKQIGTEWPRNVVFPGDWDRNGYPDMILIDGGGRMFLYPGGPGESFQSRRQIGHGWNVMNWVQGGVDWDGDGLLDIIARDSRTGQLRLYPGNGRGGFKAARVIGTGWQGFSQLALARTAAGPAIYGISVDRFYVYRGNGRGGFVEPRPLGYGWSAMTAIVPVGDWTGDGRPDMLARNRQGLLYLYEGTASGAPSGGTLVGNGWNSMMSVGASSQLGKKAALWSVGTDGRLWSYPIR